MAHEVKRTPFVNICAQSWFRKWLVSILAVKCGHVEYFLISCMSTVRCLRCLQREACFRSAACFSILLQHECILRHDILQCCSATSGGPFGCSGLLIWRLVSSVVDTWCFAMLWCLALCWHVLAGMLDMHISRPGCRGHAYACLRLYAFDHNSVPCWSACTRPLTTMDRGSQPTTSSVNVSFNSQWIYRLMFEQFAQARTSPDLSQFCF